MQNVNLFWYTIYSLGKIVKYLFVLLFSSRFMFDILAKDPKLRGLAAPSNLTMNQALDSHKGMNDDLTLIYAKRSYHFGN